MNPKILGAFVAGVAASGAAFYFATSRPAARPPVVTQVTAAPVSQVPSPSSSQPKIEPAKAELKPEIKTEAPKSLTQDRAQAPATAAKRAPKTQISHERWRTTARAAIG